jgi:hypothetical protein
LWPGYSPLDAPFTEPLQLGMHYTNSEISQLALDQLSPQQLDRCSEAFNGFADDFGKGWIEKFFRGSRAPAFVLYLLWLWDHWNIVRGLPGADELKHRWQTGVKDHGVLAEVRVISEIIQKGGAVELAPPIGTTVPDFRFRADSTWVYCEVSGRRISEPQKRTDAILSKAATVAADAVPGRHGKLSILKEVTDQELAAILSSVPRTETPSQVAVTDFARFYTDDLVSAVSDVDLIATVVPVPRQFATNLRTHNGQVIAKGTACTCISDMAAQDILEQEAAQLPRNHPGLIWLDVSTVNEANLDWPPLIQRRFQPNINTRISGAILSSTAASSDGKIETSWTLLLNPYARCPIPPEELGIVRLITGH